MLDCFRETQEIFLYGRVCTLELIHMSLSFEHTGWLILSERSEMRALHWHSGSQSWHNPHLIVTTKCKSQVPILKRQYIEFQRIHNNNYCDKAINYIKTPMKMSCGIRWSSLRLILYDWSGANKHHIGAHSLIWSTILLDWCKTIQVNAHGVVLYK